MGLSVVGVGPELSPWPVSRPSLMIARHFSGEALPRLRYFRACISLRLVKKKLLLVCYLSPYKEHQENVCDSNYDVCDLRGMFEDSGSICTHGVDSRIRYVPNATHYSIVPKTTSCNPPPYADPRPALL